MKIIFIFAQISLCLASSGPRIIAESDQEVFDPFIDIFQPTMTHLPRQGTHSSVIVKHITISNTMTSSSSVLTDTPVSQIPQDIVAIALPSLTATITTTSVKETTVSSVQPSPVTATAMNTMTNVPVDASTKSPSQLRREEMGRELKKNNKILNWAQILIGFIG